MVEDVHLTGAASILPCLVPRPKSPKKCCLVEQGHLYHVSSTTHDLMPYQRNVEAYVLPTLESFQEEIDRLEEEPVGEPGDSTWELVRHAVAEMGDTHFILILCGDVAFPGFGPTLARPTTFAPMRAIALTTQRRGGGYIMGSTHSLAVDARVENILEMKRCRDEWGTYPIDPS